MGSEKKDRKGGKAPAPVKRGLGGLADALVKAGVAEVQEARQSRHERVNEEKRLSPEELRQRAEAGAASRAAALKAQDEESRAVAATLSGAAAVERVEQLIRDNTEKSHGNRRWHYIARDGRVPFVDVADAVMRRLADGDAGVVEQVAMESAHVVVVGRQALAAIRQLDPERIRFWNA